MITITVSLWFLACVFFGLAILLPFINKTPGRLNLLAAGLFCAALTHLVAGVVVK
jgi:membrane-bound metal-dependent hydrolase YbcI (DUF457 family)